MAVLIDPETGRPFDPSIPTKMGLAANNRVVPFNTGANVTDVLGKLWDASKLQGLVPEMTPMGSLPNLPIAAKTATNAIGTGAKAGAREIARQIETGTGVFGKGAIDPREYMIAYHGSPYKFDKFDAEKIGTGAGSVHGKGGYFSSSSNYASKFKEPSSGAERTAYEILKKFGNKDDAINHLKDMKSVAYTDLGKQHQQQAIDILNSEKITPEGYLYKVDIPDEILPKMINEDLPYDQQPQDIQKLFKDFDPIAVRDKNRVDNYMRRWLRDASTSKQLQDIGYSGVKYQDSANNYVVYDPTIVKILERNGLLLK